MTKKTLPILISSLTGVSAVGAVSGVVGHRIMNRNIDKEFERERLEYIDKIIRENNISQDSFKPGPNGLFRVVHTIQYSKYIRDEQGNPIECTQLGYSLLSDKHIALHRMPETVKKVPKNLPKFISALILTFFHNKNETIEGIQYWNTRNITKMTAMFWRAHNFNQDISNWDTRNVRHINGMFYGAKSFNQPIGNWNTSNVVTMSNLFANATSFNQDISNWNVSNVRLYKDFNVNAHPEFTGSKLPKFPKQKQE
ncbi:BspA family leucine-rich repeat surface protein [Mycoplasma yeatsii]|uniref:BspA family leucine-rich repeat surface protein n=1 Tax=Mycoplasma yeatsii TaxID=51365 RepID=UPI0005B246A2|nr:BspA family leucine-rich repeat surface protein [Mycoplasma yeatsii]AJM72092.1 PARCEL domain-containing protein [Mycoplasma yeatsii GM274B]